MNSKFFPSATQSLLTPSNNPPISSLPPHLSFKSNFKFSQISIRTPNITTKASASASAANTSCIPAPVKETLYDLLGIPENGTLSEIKHAYKQLALKYHPDVSPPERAEEYTVRFIKVHEAYETLSDPEARSMYDSCMAKGLHFAFSSKRRTRFETGSESSDNKNRWKVQISELMRRSRVNPNRVDPSGGMSWAARIRTQRSKTGANGSDQDQ